MCISEKTTNSIDHKICKGGSLGHKCTTALSFMQKYYILFFCMTQAPGNRFRVTLVCITVFGKKKKKKHY